MIKTDMSNQPEVDLLLREEIEIRNLCEQFIADILLLLYKLKLSRCLKLHSKYMCIQNFTFDIVEHVQNNLPLFASKHLSTYVMKSTSIRRSLATRTTYHRNRT
jgi:hypothetical protein